MVRSLTSTGTKGRLLLLEKMPWREPTNSTIPPLSKFTHEVDYLRMKCCLLKTRVLAHIFCSLFHLKDHPNNLLLLDRITPQIISARFPPEIFGVGRGP